MVVLIAKAVLVVINLPKTLTMVTATVNPGVVALSYVKALTIVAKAVNPGLKPLSQAIPLECHGYRV
ncbi:unnamed protein product [marine sediment metagenome]|uniref:Uncharacterized protein n=1 Tax=marine sediment metagenome TaxID=412755 RepID=X1MF10_9ZZZZ